MAQLNTNAAAVSRKANLGTTAIHDILSGKNRKPSYDVLCAIANALDCDVGYLIGEQRPPRMPQRHERVAPIPVIGIVEAGAFRPMHEPPYGEEPKHLNAPTSISYPSAPHFALEVWGDSMNASKPVPLLEGMYVLCVDVAAAGLTVESGKIYVVRRTKDGGQTYELTVKRARVFRNRTELIPESTNPKHEPIVVRRELDPDSANEVTAFGLVYGAYASLED
jgi:SOS-response transcriptional repressor LexA